MTESIITGVVTGLIVGIAVAAVGAWVGYRFRRKEMRELWAEEERRRKSDRRKELYERELGIVSDAVADVAEAVQRLKWGIEKAGWESRDYVVKEAHLMVLRVGFVVASLRDQKLREGYDKFADSFFAWMDLFDFDTGGAVEGKVKEFRKLAGQTEVAASKVRRRIREILEEV